MGKWDSLLPESVLKELMLDKLLNRYLMITLCSQTLHNNAVHACRKVFALIIFNVECVSMRSALIMVWLYLLVNFTLLSLSLSPDSRKSAALLAQRRNCLFASAPELRKPPSSESSYHLQTAAS